MTRRCRAGQAGARPGWDWLGYKPDGPLSGYYITIDMADNSYPLDFAALAKGQSIRPHQLEQILGVTASDEQCFRFAVLHLKEEIEQRCGFTVRTSDEFGLLILTDAEATRYNWTETQRGVNKIRKRHWLNMQVDITKLTEMERRQFERELLVQGHLSLAIESTIRRVCLSGRAAVIDEPV